MYLCGRAATSALTPQSGRTAAQPETVEFMFLNRPQQARYYRAFASSGMSRAETVEAAAEHLCRAAEDAGWPSESWHQAPVFIGSSSYLMSDYENRYPDNCGPDSLVYLARDLQRRSGNPDIFSFATACTSSAYAVMKAADVLRTTGGRAFVLGFESFNRLTLLHFHSLGLLADHYRPFGGNGLILGEGMAALAFSTQPPVARGHLRLAGQAANTGGSTVQGDSRAQEQVIRAALAAAGAEPGSIRAVKTHGIGTADSDEAELAALNSVFGTPPPLLAFKPKTGHTLGASAALETALLAGLLQQGGSGGAKQPAALSDGLYLCNYFGFGGSNTATVWQWTS